MKFNKSKVILISFAHFTHDIFSSLLAPILPLLIDKLGISLTQAGLLDVVRKSPSFFNPFLGILAEKTNAKYFVILTPSITAISMGLLSLTSSFYIALFILFIAGLSGAFFHIPSPTMIKEFSGNESGKGMSYFMVGGESARTIGPILAAGVISIWGLEGIWKLTPIGILSSIFLYFKLKDYTPKYQAKKIETKDIKAALKKVKKFFTFIAFYIFLNNTPKYTLSLFLPLFLTHKGMSVEIASVYFAIFQGFGIIGAFYGGRISDKIGRSNALYITTIGIAIFLSLFLWQSNLIFLIPLGFFVFSNSPIILAYVHDIKTNTPTFINSIYMAMNFGINSLTIYFAGVIAEKIGLYKMFEITIILTLISLIFVYNLKKLKI